MSDDIRKKYEELDEELRPHWEQLVRAAHIRGLMISGFIWGEPVPVTDADDPYMVRFGNLQASSPQEMFAIHYQLAVMCAKMELAGKIERTVTSVDEQESLGATQDQGPLEIADKLALMLMITPLDSVPSEVLGVLEEYLKVRRPTQIPVSGKPS